MSLLQQHRPEATFGLGGDEPYARALRRSAPDSQGQLALYEVGAVRSSPRVVMDFDKWNAVADEIDRGLLYTARGPVLDIGCGPARMVRAALDRGLPALGLDVSPEAVAQARLSGLPVVEGSVFDALPDEGLWQTVLLVDGNVGIGGDVPALLARCRQLLAADGELVVEVDADDACDRSYTATLVDGSGAQSASFPWAEVGLDSLTEIARRTRFALVEAWSSTGRTFCRLARA